MWVIPFYRQERNTSSPVKRTENKRGGDSVPENIVNILESIKEAKGQEYVEGLVDMANLLAPRKTDNQPG